MRLRLPFLASVLAVFCAALPAFAQSDCLQINMTPASHVDIRQVQDTWLAWTNRVRKRLKLEPYILDPHLSATAMNWSTYAATRGTINHKRTLQSPYYDYRGIEQWFRDKGLTFENRDGITFSESIGWGVYTCKKQDCTEELSSAIRSTFDFFMAERAKAYRPHYNCLTNPRFTKVGIGIAESRQQGRYYLTVHYATDFTPAPLPLCSAS
jgi:hypothetical protein